MACGGPILITWTSPPCFSLMRRPSSTAYSSKGLVMLATPSRTSVFVLGSIFTSVVSGTCLIHTAIFTISSSFSFEIGFSFLDEGGHPFLLIFRSKTEAEGIGFQRTTFCKIHIETGIDDHFGQPDTHHSIPGDL